MAKACALTGKQAQRGSMVSHSHRKTNRRFNVNFQTKKVLNPATGKFEKVTLSTRAFRTLLKWQQQGKKFDIRDLA